MLKRRLNASSSTVRYESRVKVDRPIDEVFARLADLPGYSSWMHRTGLFRRCGQVSDGQIQQGTRYFDATRMGTYSGVVVTFEPPSTIAFRETLRWFGAVMEARPTYFLESDQETTIVHHIAEGELFGWTHVMKPAAALLARSERGRTLESLRRSLEST